MQVRNSGPQANIQIREMEGEKKGGRERISLCVISRKTQPKLEKEE